MNIFLLFDFLKTSFQQFILWEDRSTHIKSNQMNSYVSLEFTVDWDVVLAKNKQEVHGVGHTLSSYCFWVSHGLAPMTCVTGGAFVKWSFYAHSTSYFYILKLFCLVENPTSSKSPFLLGNIDGDPPSKSLSHGWWIRIPYSLRLLRDNHTAGDPQQSR